MKAFWRIVRYAYPYKGTVILSVLANLFATVFALASIGLVVPVLQIIFDNTKAPEQAPVFDGDIMAYAEDFLSYEIGTRMEAIGQQEALLYVCFWVISAFFLKNVFRYLALYLLAPMRNGITRDIRLDLHHKLLALPVGYFTEQRKGDIISRMTADLKEIENGVLATIEMFFREPFIILSSLAVLVWMSPQLTIFVLLLLPVVSLLITRIGKSLKRASTRAQESMGDILSLTEETVSGLKVIKAFTAEEQKASLFARAANNYFSLMNKVIRRNDLASPISEFMGSLVMAIIIWYGGSLVMEPNDFTAEKFIAYVLFFYQIIPPSKSLSQASYKIQRGNASSERVLDLLDAENPIQDKPDAKDLKEFKDAIEFNDVCFSYQDKQVLSHIDLKIEKGKTYALVGQSGGGKTTLTNLVPRFYDINSGSLKIDGLPIDSIKLKDLRSHLGIVTQETLLFNETVAYNIALGKPDATKEEIIAAAKIANAHDFIEKLPNGYLTNIGDAGGKLSGGQKQRLSIARAVLKNPPILILDEATSALDTESEKLVQDALYRLMENRTSLVIAHRLSTIQHADEIVVINEGKISERGSHQELLDKQGIYHKLVEMQSFA
ncbi:ABC transporter ATP-binding protein [Croceimicrobium hydrocarbonivorans]|uniref:ABC transporter ATP-binding protein n=1 Tax=Croceimicrobium hydrocarbonivorans TaxID=2761580 RepID=A0A7H0VIR3_9FLAO|nr:ABC transporter ATP-binding protein [Croceimicrobium hydrocarbonivorans]QNR25611.1 ABC transporter ATP-binding protein [Croceimicrobium hydrocarbonivorans]